jgi:hypothetical protein
MGSTRAALITADSQRFERQCEREVGEMVWVPETRALPLTSRFVALTR